VKYNHYFLPLTFLMLGGAFYFTFFIDRKSSIWQKWLLIVVATVSILIISYGIAINS
jgi:hypothetical protein